MHCRLSASSFRGGVKLEPTPLTGEREAPHTKMALERGWAPNRDDTLEDLDSMSSCSSSEDECRHAATGTGVTSTVDESEEMPATSQQQTTQEIGKPTL